MDVHVYGESMWPLVRQGDRVRIDPEQAPSRGRLAAALSDGHLVVHRVVDLTESHCVLLGDFGGRPLSIPIGEVLGVVTRQWTREGRAFAHESKLLLGAGWLASVVTPRTRLPWRMARSAHRRLSTTWRTLQKR